MKLNTQKVESISELMPLLETFQIQIQSSEFKFSVHQTAVVFLEKKKNHNEQIDYFQQR